MLLKTIFKYLIFNACLDKFFETIIENFQGAPTEVFYRKIISIDQSLIFNNCYIIDKYYDVFFDENDEEIECEMHIITYESMERFTVPGLEMGESEAYEYDDNDEKQQDINSNDFLYYFN
jgi:hypothetical protein